MRNKENVSDITINTQSVHMKNYIDIVLLINDQSRKNVIKYKYVKVAT